MSPMKVYIAILVTREDDEMNINVIGASRDKAKVEDLADRQRKFTAKSQIIDLFETEEIQ